jgi:hypothetical protein
MQLEPGQICLIETLQSLMVGIYEGHPNATAGMLRNPATLTFNQVQVPGRIHGQVGVQTMTALMFLPVERIRFKEDQLLAIATKVDPLNKLYCDTLNNHLKQSKQ